MVFYSVEKMPVKSPSVVVIVDAAMCEVRHYGRCYCWCHCKLDE